MTILFAAAADGRAFIIDRNTLLRYVMGRQGFVVSTDPAATIANVVTTPANGVATAVIAATNTGGSAVFMTVESQLSKGETIFLCSSAAGGIQLFFDDTTAENA